MRYPGQLNEAVAAWLDEQGGSLRAGAAAMTARYGKGASSIGIDLAAYVAARLPATHAVNLRVLGEVAGLLPDFAPQSLRDVGAGPGTAGWAALGVWPGIAQIEQVEASAPFRALAGHFNGESGLAALAEAAVVAGDLRALAGAEPRDLVVASYVLAELPEAEAGELALRLWQGAKEVLVLVEPGSPQGFARIRRARDALIKAGGHVAGPCTHDLACPITGADWCHFKERVQRSRAHMHAKGASVPFEDEPYSWLAVARMRAVRGAGRIIGPAAHTKAGLSLRVCADGSIAERHIASRDKATYKRLRKMAWGDSLPIG